MGPRPRARSVPPDPFPLTGQERFSFVEEVLLHVEAAGPEPCLGVRQTEGPQPVEDLVEAERGDLVGALGEPLAPQAQRLGVVGAERVAAGRAQPAVVACGLLDRPRGGDATAGEDVLVDPGGGVAGGGRPLVRHGDGLQRHPAARSQPFVQGAEVHRQGLRAHRPGRLHPDDGVVLPARLAVVAQLDTDPRVEPRRTHSLPGQVPLLPGEGERGDAGAAGGGPQGQLAPAGAGLQQPGSLAHVGQVEQPVDLAVLGRGEPVPARREASEDGGGVGEGVVEEEGGQVVGQVVGAAVVGAGAVGRVALVVRVAWRPQSAQSLQPLQSLQRGRDQVGGVPGEHREGGHQVGGVPLAGQVGLAEPDQTAGADPGVEGGRVAHLEQRPAQPDIAPAGEPGPQGQPAEGTPDEGRGHGGTGAGGGGSGLCCPHVAFSEVPWADPSKPSGRGRTGNPAGAGVCRGPGPDRPGRPEGTGVLRSASPVPARQARLRLLREGATGRRGAPARPLASPPALRNQG